MRVITRQGLQVLRRARAFLAENNVTVALGSITKHVEALGGVIDRLGGHAVVQDASHRAFHEGTSAARQLKRALQREYMLPVAHMARSLFPDDPPARASLGMPDVITYEGVIAAAFAMAERATEHKERFVKAGFGDDFVDRLRKAAGDLRAALDLRQVSFGRRSAATAGMVDETARGRDIVRLLDVMVAPQLKGAPDRLAQWRTLSRFVRSAAAAVEITPPTPTATPPAATPVAAATPAESLDRAA